MCTAGLPNARRIPKFMAMTALAASLPFPRPQRERLPFGAALLSIAAHALAALIVAAIAYFVAPLAARPMAEERTVEVVMVPAAAAPDAFEPPPNAAPLPAPPPPNLDQSAALADRTVLPQAARPQAATSADNPAPEAVSPRPSAATERAADRSSEAAVPEDQAPAPSPQGERPSTVVMMAQAPRAVPPRNEGRPRPESRAEAGPRGELREFDLFGPGRLGARQAAATRGGTPSPPAGEASRGDSDFILAQILRRWRINYHDERYREVTFAPGNLQLRADGTLAPPYGPNDPWNPYDMMGGYRRLTQRGFEDVRRAVDTFLVALREAQPFQLPPTPGPYPRRIRISFRTGDL